MAAEKTSLQRLQSLDSNFSSFRERLSELESIVFQNETNFEFYGRKDWALKWILKSLQTSTDEDTPPRLSPTLWHVLTRLITQVDPSSAIQVLHSNNIVECLDRTLSEIVKHHEWDDLFIFEMAERPEDGSAALNSSDGSKKRKLNLARSESPQKAHAAELLVALSGFLSQAIGLPSHLVSTGQLAFKRPLPSPFANADPAMAASVLGNWLRAMIGLEDSQSSELTLNLLEGLRTLLQTWAERAISEISDTAGDDISSCSKACLLPSVGLLCRIYQKKSFGLQSYEASSATIIEQFVARELLIPTKSVYLAQTRAQSKKSTDQKDPLEPLKTLLKPVSEALKVENTKYFPSAGASYLLSRLFLLLLRSTPRTSPKQKLAEKPWLEAMFLRICSCAGIEIKSRSSTLTNKLRTLLLNDLLEAALRFDIKFSHDILQEIMEHDTGLSQSMPDQLDWPLLEKLVAMDPNIFLQDSMPKDPYHDNNLKSPAAILFLHLSQTHYKDEDKFISPFEDSIDPNCWRRSMQNIIVPLFWAFVEARMLSVFLEYWYDSLVALFEGSIENQYSIMDDLELHHTVSNGLQTSLTANQILAILSKRTDNLEEGNDVSRKLRTPSLLVKKRANSIILRAIFTSTLGNYELASSLSKPESALYHRVFGSTLKSILDVLKEATAGGTINQSFTHVQLWQLLAVVHQCWAAIAETDDISHRSLLPDEALDEMMNLFAALHSSNSKRNHSERVTVYNNSLAAFGTLCGILNDASRRNWNIETLRNLTITSLKWFNIFEETHSTLGHSTRMKLISVIGIYPTLLADSSEESFKLLRRIGEIEAKEMQTSEGSTKVVDGPWSRIIQRSLEGSPKLLENILNVLSFLQQDGVKPTGSDPATFIYSAFVEHSYLQIPNTCMTRKQRKKILDEFLRPAITHHLCSNLNQWSRRLSLVLHVIKHPEAAKGLDLQPKELVRLGITLDEFILNSKETWDDDLEVQRILKSIAEHCVRRYVEADGDDSLSALLTALEANRTAKSSWNSSLARLSHISIISGVLDAINIQDHTGHSHNRASGNFEKALCGRVCDLGKDVWNQYEKSNVDLSELLRDIGIVVELLAKFSVPALQEHRFGVDSNITIAERTVSATGNIYSPAETEHRNALIVLSYSLRSRLDGTERNVADLQTPYNVLHGSPSPFTRTLLADTLEVLYANSSDETRASLLKTLLEDCKSATEEEAPSRWTTLHILVSAEGMKSSANTSGVRIPVTVLPQLLIALASALSTKSHIKSSLTIASSIAALLQNTHNHKAVSQLGIDTILSGTTAVLSSVAQDAPSLKTAAKLYVQLTTIIRLLLLQHRHRLRGRFDLLIATLQALLRPLFARQPGETAELTLPLTPKHAQRFTRLVTLFCDPTVSSTATSLTYVPKTKARAGPSSQPAKRPDMPPLTDETFKARKHAGQYVPALLLLLCELQLKGRFVAEGVREALVPAVYIMFDVMETEVLGAVFGAAGHAEQGVGMSSGVRTVFRGWWEAWQRERKRRVA